jgi:hypothetical protein
MRRHPFEQTAEELLLELKALDNAPKRKGCKKTANARRRIAADALGLLLHCGGAPSLVLLFEQLIADRNSIFSWATEKERGQAARSIATLFDAENPGAPVRTVARVLVKDLGGDVEKYRKLVDSLRTDEKYQRDVQYFRRIKARSGGIKLIIPGEPIGGEY